MFTGAVSSDTLRGIKILGSSGVLSNAYLAGGTALTLQIGHRLSLDLDFFTQQPFEEISVAGQLGKIGDFEREQLSWRTVLGTFEKTKFSLFYYEYPLVTETHDFEGIKLADPRDIAAMKLLAISDRGARRDFVDLYFMREMFTLESVFKWYGEKFGQLEEKKYHLLRGLQYFEDALTQDMPVMLLRVQWENVQKYFEREVKRLSNKWGI